MKFFWLIVAALAIIWPQLAGAQATASVSGNMYRAGNVITIDNTVDGDVYIVGQTARISGQIQGDVLVIAQEVIIDGVVRGDLRAVAQKIIISGSVEGNVSFVADAFDLSDTGKVGRSISGVSTYCTLVGSVGADVDGVYSSVVLANSVGRNVNVRVHNDFSSGLQIASTAHINGAVDYYAYREATPATHAQIGGQVTWHQYAKQATSAENQPISLSKWILMIISLIGLGLLSWIFWWVGGSFFDRVIVTMQQRTGAAIWSGILLLLLLPLCAVLIAVTLIGIPLALFVLALYGLGLLLFAPWAVIAIGQVVVGLMSRRLQSSKLVIVVVGSIIFLSLINLPFIGPLLYLLLVILVWGSWWQSSQLKIKRS